MIIYIYKNYYDFSIFEKSNNFLPNSINYTRVINKFAFHSLNHRMLD